MPEERLDPLLKFPLSHPLEVATAPAQPSCGTSLIITAVERTGHFAKFFEFNLRARTSQLANVQLKKCERCSAVMLLLRALSSFYLFYGGNLKIECPTESGKLMNLSFSRSWNGGNLSFLRHITPKTEIPEQQH
jgi:hypothetical protein